MAKKTTTTKRNRLNPARIKTLYRKMKSVSGVAKKVGASYMGVRRQLIVQKLIKA